MSMLGETLFDSSYVTAGDHINLEDLINAYSAYEGYRLSDTTDQDSAQGSKKDTANAIVGAEEDVALSDRMMDVSLGA